METRFSKELYRELFDAFNKTEEGSLTLEEYIMVMCVCNDNICNKTIEKIFNNDSKDGLMNFEQFLFTIQRNLLDDGIDEEEIKEAFEIFDVDGDGEISIRDYEIIMTKLGEKVTTEILEETFNEMGLGPKDNINYELFKTFIA
jgi:calmodulin